MTPASLAEWRKARGMSQQTLADVLGCSRRSIVNWEGGTNAIPQYIALACAAIAKRLMPAG